MSVAKRVIPCLDVDAGRVVKGVKFVEIRDAGDPVEVARRYAEAGADEITFLDITASSDARETMVDMVRAVAGEVFIPLTVGGGIRAVADIQRMLDAGADKVGINTAAVTNPALVAEASAHFGAQAIVVAIDARRVVPRAASAYAGARSDGHRSGNPAGDRMGNPRGKVDADSNIDVAAHTDTAPRWEVYTHGGRKPTGLDAVAWARQMAEAGAGEILLTSMDRDGTKDGFDCALTRAVADAVPIPVIASGGVGNLQHLVDGVREGHADAVLAASIFHFAAYTIAEAKAFMHAAGIEVRL